MRLSSEDPSRENRGKVEAYPLKSGRIEPNTSLYDACRKALSDARLRLRNGDIIAVSSKAVALSEGTIQPLRHRSTSARASSLAKKHGMSADFVQLVLDEADEVYGGVRGALLTLKAGDAVANAGVDMKNAPPGYAVFWPRRPRVSARALRKRLEKHYKKRLGIVIVDSRVTPLRLGTVGLALAVSGFIPITDLRMKQDLFGRLIRITRHAVADDVASVAHLMMGESAERTPFALIRGVPVGVAGSETYRRRMQLPPEDCLYMSQLRQG